MSHHHDELFAAHPSAMSDARVVPRKTSENFRSTKIAGIVPVGVVTF